MNFGEKVSILRKKRGVTLNEMAEMLCVTKQTLVNWENGGTPRGGMENLLKISKFFHIPAGDLINDKVDIFSEEYIEMSRKKRIIIDMIDGKC